MTVNPSPSAQCRACKTPTTTRFVARERYAGLPGSFEYGECPHCRSLSLIDVPTNLADFYAGDYYSFAQPNKVSTRIWLFGCRTTANLTAALRVIPSRQARILDVGCGAGHLVRTLVAQGYTSAEGIDPFMPESTAQTSAPRLRRASISDLQETWDVIMYHHVLEHVADPFAEIAAAAARLAPGGQLLIRVPLASSYLRQRYGVDWYQWDAPRHIWLPTPQALDHLANSHHLRLTSSWSDATVAPIWISRLYSQNLSHGSPFHAPYGPLRNRLLAHLPFDYLRLALTKLTGRSDQACFVFTHAAAD